MSATAARSRTGSHQRRKTKHGRQHQPKLSHIYRFKRPDVEMGKQHFRIRILRPDYHDINVEGVASHLEWRYDSGDPVMHGSITILKPHPEVEPLHLHDGHVVVLSVYYNGKWIELWRMRADNSSFGLNGSQWTAELNDDGLFLQESTDDWHYTKSKRRGKPKGWKCHEIVKDVAKRYRIPLGKVAEGKHYITDLSGTDMSPLQVIQKAYALEKQATGRRFVISWQGGKLNILPMVRNELMYIFKQQIQDAALGLEPRDDAFATAVTVRASIKDNKSKDSHGKSHKNKKVVKLYVDQKAVKQYGFIHKTLDGSTVHSVADADKKAKRYIATHGVRKRTITGMQHYGLALIKRGDAVDVEVPSEGFHGDKAICFVGAGTWSLDAGQFSMSLDLSFDDPWKGVGQRRKAKDKKTRAKKRGH